MRNKFICVVAVILSTMAFTQQTKVKKVAAIGFLNVENLWDTIRSADYIDGTKDKTNPAYHRSIPLDSIKFWKWISMMDNGVTIY